jgi:hypothetical protein
VVDAAAADTGLLLLSSIVSRRQTYASAGMTTGYFQRYAQRSNSAGNVLAYWLAGVYATSAEAASMVDLGKQAIQSHATPAVTQACPAQLPSNCGLFVTTSISNTVHVGYAVWSTVNVLAEVALVVYSGTSAFPTDVFAQDMNRLVLAANDTTSAVLYPAPTATNTTAPVLPTSLPTRTPTATPSPTATATATPLPLFVSVRLQHRSVKAGAQQAVNFPDGATKRHHGTADGRGAATWTYRQPAGHTTASKRTARVVVTVRMGSQTPMAAGRSYVIR